MILNGHRCRQTLQGLLLGAMLSSSVSTTVWAGGQVSMLPLERKLARQFSDVSHMLPERLEALRSDRSDNIVVLDVREPREFEISHLPGALRVDPGIGKSDFMATFAPKLKGKTVVFYCSVGRRSSILASRVQQQLLEAGVKDVHNLRGGIFAWHNTGRVVMKGDTETDFVHPYSKSWSRYLDFDNYAQYGKDESWWWWQ